MLYGGRETFVLSSGSYILTDAHGKGPGLKGIKYPLGFTDSRLARRWWKSVARP